MLVNADFSRRVMIAPHEYRWVASPQAGVERMMLDRVGAEHARATSVVRYAPGAWFPCHAHSAGEEILVLSGVFSEGHQDYPAGWYLRNPPGSEHQPSSAEGATIFVKLQQMSVQDQHRVRINTRDPAAWQRHGEHEVCPLFSNALEQVRLLRVPSYATVLTESPGGSELLVLSGELKFEGRSYGGGSWMRQPAGTSEAMAGGARGAVIYLKTGHLRNIAVEVSACT